jgi:hypothetical protein
MKSCLVPNLDVFCIQDLRGFKQSELSAVGFGFSGTILKPVGNELQFDVLCRYRQESFSYPCEFYTGGYAQDRYARCQFPEADSSGRLYPFPEFETAYFTTPGKHPRGCPKQTHQFHIIFHGDILYVPG